MTADEDGGICIWRIQDGKLRTKLQMTSRRDGSKVRVTVLAFDPNYRRIVAGSEDGNLKVGDLRALFPFVVRGPASLRTPEIDRIFLNSHRSRNLATAQNVTANQNTFRLRCHVDICKQ